MATNPRSALDRLIGALESFHQAATTADDPEASSVLEAADALADAYTVYDDVIFTEFGVESPLDSWGDDDSDDDEIDYNDDDYDFDDSDEDSEDGDSDDDLDDDEFDDSDDDDEDEDDKDDLDDDYDFEETDETH